MEIRNISPLGDLDVVLLQRIVSAGEVVDVTDDQAVELCAGLANFEPVDAAAFALILPPEPEPELEPEPDDVAEPTADPYLEPDTQPEPEPGDEPEDSAPAGRKTKTKEV